MTSKSQMSQAQSVAHELTPTEQALVQALVNAIVREMKTESRAEAA